MGKERIGIMNPQMLKLRSNYATRANVWLEKPNNTDCVTCRIPVGLGEKYYIKYCNGERKIRHLNCAVHVGLVAEELMAEINRILQKEPNRTLQTNELVTKIEDNPTTPQVLNTVES